MKTSMRITLGVGSRPDNSMLGSAQDLTRLVLSQEMLISWWNLRLKEGRPMKPSRVAQRRSSCLVTQLSWEPQKLVQTMLAQMLLPNLTNEED